MSPTKQVTPVVRVLRPASCPLGRSISDAERHERPLMIWAMGTWLLWAQGLASIRRGRHLGLSSAPNMRRDLSILRIGAKLFKKALGGPPGLTRAMAG